MESKANLFRGMFMYRPKGGGKAGMQKLMAEMSRNVRDNFPYPVIANWLCNASCNYKCFYCPLNNPNYRPKEKELPIGEARALIDKVASSGVKTFIINGGEPLLRSDLGEIIQYADSKNLEVALFSNMSLMTGSVIAELKAAGLANIIVSLDAANRNTYSSVKGVDCFEHVLSNVRKASEAGINIIATMGVTRDNNAEVEGFVQVCIENNIPNAVIWMPIASSKENVNRVLDARERNQLYKKIYRLSETFFDKIALVAHPCDGQWLRVLLEMSGKNVMENLRFKMITNMARGCMAATYMVGLSLEGNVFPCGATMGDKGEGLGNIFKDDLLDIWNHSDVMLKIRNRELKGKCNQCHFKKNCGGCRMVAWLNSGDYLESDRTCIHALDDPQSTSGLIAR